MSTVTPLPQPAGHSLRQRSLRTTDAARSGSVLPRRVRSIFSSLLPGDAAPRSHSAVAGTGSNSLSARNAPHATALSSREPCRVNPLAPGDRSRAAYPSRAGLIAAICVSWTIALVAGVVLIGGLQ